MLTLANLRAALLEMEKAGLIKQVTRPDGEIGWVLTDTGEQAADQAAIDLELEPYARPGSDDYIQ